MLINKSFFAILRKPIIALFLSLVMLLFSCEQYESFNLSDPQKFDYSIYGEFISDSDNQFILEIIKSFDEPLYKGKNQNNVEFLSLINERFNTDLSYPEEFINIYKNDYSEIPDILIENGWINEMDLNQIDAFINNVLTFGFEIALIKFEETVLNSNYDDKQFRIKNNFANSIKALNYYSPELFELKIDQISRYGSGCFKAAIALIAASAALAACLTVIACGLAVTGWILAYDAYVNNCLK